jgi:cytoskeletal protein CcmA (bactofilin family)
LLCSGDLVIKRKGKIGGEIQARNIRIDRKSEAEFAYPIRAEVVEIDGAAAVPSILARRVVINKTGRLIGAVTAQGFVVEKGGYFAGDLTIGEADHPVSEAAALVGVADSPPVPDPGKPPQDRGDELVAS